MILRTHFVLLCCFSTGYFTTGSLYVKFRSVKVLPDKKDLNTAEDNTEHADTQISDQDKISYRRGKSHYQKLVLLDRKDERVEAFVQKLIKMIEKNTHTQIPHGNDHRIRCHRTFGSIYDAKNKRLLCKKEHKLFKKPSINFVIPVKKDIFFDATRHGSEDYNTDTKRRFVDSDYIYDDLKLSHKKRNKTKIGSSDKDKFGEGVEVHFRAQDSSESSEAEQPIKEENPSESLLSPSGQIAKRFKIVKNKNELIISGNKNTEINDASDSDTVEKPHQKPKNKKKQLDSESDTNDLQSEKESVANDWKTEKESKHSNKNGVVSVSNEADYGSLSKEDLKPKPKKQKKRNSKYLYMQGPVRLVDSDLDTREDARRTRDLNYFLPKDRIWTNKEVKDLGYYWYEGAQGHKIRTRR